MSSLLEVAQALARLQGQRFTGSETETNGNGIRSLEMHFEDGTALYFDLGSDADEDPAITVKDGRTI